MLNLLKSFFGNLLNKAIIKPLSSAISIGFMWAFHGLNRLFPEQAHWLASKITETYHVFPEEWAAFAKEYLSLMTGIDIDIEEIIGKDGTSLADLISRGLGERFLSPMLNLILGDVEELTPEKGVENAQRFIVVNLAFQMQQWVLHLLGDMCSFGMFKSFKDLPNAIAWTYGIGWLSWIAMGPWFQRTIADPLRWHINKTWRPEIFTEDQAIKLWRLGILSSSQRDEILSYHGWSEEKIAQLIELKEPAFTESELEQAWRWWGMRDSEAIKEIKRRGFGDARAKWKWNLIKEEKRRDIIEKIAKEAGRLYKEGKISQRDLRDFLRQAGFKDDEISLEIEKLEIEHRASKGLTPANVWDLYQRGVFSWSEAKSELNTIGFDDTDAEYYLKAQRRMLTPREYIRLWKKAYISRAELKDKLQRWGYSEEDAEFLIRLEE